MENEEKQELRAEPMEETTSVTLYKKDKDLWENIKHIKKNMEAAHSIPETVSDGTGTPGPERFQSDADTGLTSEQVRKRVEDGLVNTAVESASKTAKEIVYSNVFTYFNLIFLVITIFLCVVGSFRNLTFLPVVIANTLIGIIQELRAKKTLDDLRILNTLKCRVVRDGQESMTAAEDIVLDDIVIFRGGNQIPADGTVVSGKVLVNEALVTGESEQIEKTEGDTLLSGSFIVSGECRARIDRVGKDSYVSKLTLQAKQMNDEESSEMIRSLDRLVRWVGVIIIPIGLILFGQQYFINHSGIRSSVTSTVAAILGMIPEGLYLLASAALFVSVVRLAVQKVLVHNMKCIETLARVDVLCVDKTGTITDNTMTVKQIRFLHEPASEETQILDDVMDAESGHPLLPAERITEEEKKKIELAIGDFSAGMPADNITIKAMKEYFRKRSGKRPEQIFPFSSELKYSGAVFGEEQYVLGAPEFVLRSQYPAYAAQVENAGRQGYRVLLFGRYLGVLDGKALTEAVKPLALVLLSNPVRANAKETFAYFADQGVKIKVISGDNPLTVSEIAKEAGIEGAENWVDASLLYQEEEVAGAAEKYTVFGRVSPEQKRTLISALKKAGHTVAMTGDGVNDVLALKDADCSIALASGSDAAAQVSQLVLLESDFSKMPAVVAEGRRVVNNIERTAALFLVKNIFSLLLSIFSLVLMVNSPLEPSQVSLISMFTIGIPAFLLSQEQNTDRIEGHFMSNVLFKALPGGLTDFLIVSVLYLFCMEFKMNETDISTSSTILLAIVGLMILYRIASPMTKIHWTIWFLMAAGLLYCMIFVSSIFSITTISKQSLMILLLFAVVTEPTYRYLYGFMQKISRAYGRWKRKKS